MILFTDMKLAREYLDPEKTTSAVIMFACYLQRMLYHLPPESDVAWRQCDVSSIRHVIINRFCHAHDIA